MDENLGGDTIMQSWEQYICPPVSEDIRLGDILRRRDGKIDDPRAFKVVLTPSCDLVASGGRTPKVKQVLVAGCLPIRKAVESLGMSGLSSEKDKERLRSSLLSQGHRNGVIPLPELKGRIPPITVSLRELELIPFDEIHPNNGQFERVASVDSPFRELIAWAYMQVGCRPGVPDRDLSTWCEEIAGCLAPKKD
jgi:CTP synthase